MVGQCQDAAGGDVQWIGRRRPSMDTNILLAPCELGKPRKTTFAKHKPGHVFGQKMPPDAEGAKQVTMQWRAHQPNPHATPGPDFKAMNRLAADSGLTAARDARALRESHHVSLRWGPQGVARRPALPSDRDPAFAYGRPPGHRSAEERRSCGPSEPPVAGLVTGAYARAWVDMNAARAEELEEHHGYIKPAPTRATHGHRLGALRAVAPRAESGWKMSKFLRTPPRVTAYMGGVGGVGGGGRDEAAEEAAASQDG